MDVIDLTGDNEEEAPDAAKLNASAPVQTTAGPTTEAESKIAAKDATDELNNRLQPKQSGSTGRGPIGTGRTHPSHSAAMKRSYSESPNSDSSDTSVSAPKRSSPRVKRRRKKIRLVIHDESDDDDDDDDDCGINKNSPRKKSKASPKKEAKKPPLSPKEKKSPAALAVGVDSPKKKSPVVLAVGSTIRKRYNIGWFDAEVISSSDGKTAVKFSETDEVEELSDDDALMGLLAYQFKHTNSGYQRPQPGTQVLKRFEDEDKQSFWIDGSIIGYEKEPSKSMVRFTDGDEEYLTDDEAMTCAAAHSLFRSSRGRKRLESLIGATATPIGNSTNLLSLIGATGPPQRKGIGTMIRKQYETRRGKEWYDGKIVEQDENYSRAYFEPSDLCPDGYYTDVADDELEACAHAYNVHHFHQPKKLPSVGSNVRVMYSEGWWNGTILSKTKNGKENEEYVVQFEDGQKQKMGTEDVRNYSAEYERYSQSVLGDETRVRDDDMLTFQPSLEALVGSKGQQEGKALNEDSVEDKDDKILARDSNIVTVVAGENDVVATKQKTWTLKHKGTLAYGQLVEQFAQLLPPARDQGFGARLDEFSEQIMAQIIEEKKGRFLKLMDGSSSRCVVMDRPSTLKKIKDGLRNRQKRLPKPYATTGAKKSPCPRPVAETTAEIPGSNGLQEERTLTAEGSQENNHGNMVASNENSDSEDNVKAVRTSPRTQPKMQQRPRTLQAEESFDSDDNVKAVQPSPRKSPKKQKRRQTLQAEDSFDSIVASELETPVVGLKIRKYFYDVDKWFVGEVIFLLEKRDSRARVRFSDGDEQTMTFGEIHVTHRAYLLHQLGLPKIQEPGTRISKRFDQGWHDGTIVRDEETNPMLSWGKNLVKFDDGEQEYMGDEEAQQCAMAFHVIHRFRKR